MGDKDQIDRTGFTPIVDAADDPNIHDGESTNGGGR